VDGKIQQLCSENGCDGALPSGINPSPKQGLVEGAACGSSEERLHGRMKQFLRVVSFAAGAWYGLASMDAQIVAEPAAVDLGRQTQQQVLESKVSLVNSGKETVTIYDVHADCSCTVGIPGKQSLEPGERTSLSIKTETRVYQGEITRRVVLRTSAGDVTVPVTVTVSPYERWEFKPPFLTLAASGRGKEAAGEVTLKHLGAEPVKIEGITAAPDWVSGVVAQQEGKEFLVKLAKRTDAPAGHHIVKMTVTTTDAVNPQVSFNVFMSVTSGVSVKPNPLVMPASKVGREARLKAELTGWDGGLPPRLELAHGKAVLLGTGKEGIAFEIVVTPEKTGAMTQLLRVYAGDELEIEVPVIFRAE
jgi:hypothetical protein